MVLVRPNYIARFLTALFLALSITMSSAPLADAVKQTSESRPPVPCDQDKGIGAVFYNFETLFIYYADFPYQGKQKLPEPLTYDHFNERLLETVRKNFAACLKTGFGTEKPIVVIPPPTIRGDAQQLLALRPGRIHNPKNLTILVRVSYVGYPPRPSDVEDFGQAFFFIYRPEVSHKLARLPMPNNSGMITFFPRKGEKDLERWLDGFFKQIKPRLSWVGPGMDRLPPEKLRGIQKLQEALEAEE